MDTKKKARTADRQQRKAAHARRLHPYFQAGAHRRWLMEEQTPTPTGDDRTGRIRFWSKRLARTHRHRLAHANR